MTLIFAASLWFHIVGANDHVQLELANSGYYISVYTSELVDWFDALLLCRSMGSDLASIHSNQDNINAYDAISKLKHNTIGSDTFNYAWIGYNDLKAEGAFEWADDSINNYTNWLNSEPNNSNKEDCTHLIGNNFTYGYYWNNRDCTDDSLHLFVCNFKPNISKFTLYTYVCISKHKILLKTNLKSVLRKHI